MSSKQNGGLKSAIDLAMERMAGKAGEGLVNLTAEQKEAIAEITRRTKAKIAEMEILYRKRIVEAREAKDEEKTTKLEEELSNEIARIRAREDADKQRARGGQGG